MAEDCVARARCVRDVAGNVEADKTVTVRLDRTKPLTTASLTGQENSGGETPPGCVGWWRAEGSGKDEIAGNDGALLGGTLFTAGRSGLGFES